MTEEELFASARRIQDAAERAAYLDRACAADPDLRRRVEARLDGAPDVGDVPEGGTPLTGPGQWISPAEALRPPEGPGGRVGPYKLLQLLGEGGMGAVFLAEQEHPVKRRVALKIIKAGMDSARVVARFEAERQALALMDHPNIARVLDAGTTERGRPYFVMELVKGIPITRFCDQEHLTPRERLELFVPVCQAVQHAHQKGIIHRDLKPSNVLIALYDGRPVPKVIDFGVAKAMGQKLTERTMFTEVGQIVGTLEYMAPEQAELNNLDIDTRADIYSLGVLLYELLAGSPPFTAKQLRGAAFDEMLRMIREVEPPRPSTKLSSSEELPAIAAKRKLEPAKLARLVRGDLDWVVMKCLEKERARRYETANGLAMDLQRYLADEPVVAGPPGARYRLRKFLRRNRRGVVAAGLLLFSLLAGLAGTSWGLVEARRQRDRALAAEGQARDQEGKARANFELARGAVQEYGRKVSNDPRLKEKDLEQLRKELLQSAVTFHQRFVEQHQDDPALLADLGQAARDLAKLLGDIDDNRRAIAYARQAVAAYERLAAEHPEGPKYALELGQSLDRLGSLLDENTEPQEGRAALARAVETLEAARRAHGSSPELREAYLGACGHLAYTLRYKIGAQAESLAVCRRGVAFLEEEGEAAPPPLEAVKRAQFLSFFGLQLAESGHKDEAPAWCKKAADLLERATPGDTDFEYRRATVYSHLGRAYRALRDLPAAQEALRRELALWEKLATDHPGVRSYQDGVGRVLTILAPVQMEAGQTAAALASYKRAVEVKDGLVARNPDVPDYKANLARSLDNLALHTRDLAEARKHQGRAESLLKELTARYPKVDQYQASLGEACYTRSVLHERARQFPQALEALDEALAVTEGLVRTSDVAQHRGQLLHFYEGKMELCLKSGRLEPAAAAYRKAAALAPRRPQTHQLYGSVLLQAGRLEEALAVSQKALALKPDFAEAQCNVGLALVRLGRFAEARDALRRGHELGSKQPNWRFPSALWVRNAEALLELERRLPAILEGKDKPANNGERLSLAILCGQMGKHLYAASARFYREAFAADARLGDDPRALHRYNAACAAALAGCGRGEDAKGLDAAQRAALRKQALEWLRADLAGWAKLYDSPEQRDRARQALRHWQEDKDLAGVRGAAALAALPADEGTAWRALWSSVAEVLDRTGE